MNRSHSFWRFWILSIVFFSSAAPAHGGNWTKGMKGQNELKEIVDSMRPWESGNHLVAIELKGSSYAIKSERCEFIFNFDYDQQDPEKGVKRKQRVTLVSGQREQCSRFFKE